MNRRITIAAVVVATSAGCSDVSMLSHPISPEPTMRMSIGSPDRLTGHWEVDLLDFDSPPRAQYSATALRHQDGTVSGQFQVHEEGFEGVALRVHGETTCLTIAADGTARAGGRITQVAFWDPTLNRWEPLTELVGAHAVWRVKDNGEGSNSAPDLASDIRAGFPAEINVADRFCAGTLQLLNVVTYPLVRGNVQVESSIAGTQ
jgi:hypothetical protein